MSQEEEVNVKYFRLKQRRRNWFSYYQEQKSQEFFNGKDFQVNGEREGYYIGLHESRMESPYETFGNLQSEENIKQNKHGEDTHHMKKLSNESQGGGAVPLVPLQHRGRGPLTREELQKLREEELINQNHGKDCFIVPQANSESFLPEGVTALSKKKALSANKKPFIWEEVPQESRNSNQVIDVIEVENPKLIVSFHLMGGLHPISPALENPLVNHLDIQLELAKQLLKTAQDLNATEGFLFKNLEKDVDYTYINYYVMKNSQREAGQFHTRNQVAIHDTLSPSHTGYSLVHSMDLYDEVATIARPPIDTNHKQPSTSSTGYIICIYQVFKGDDGEKFEKNWLYWTGARMLYKNLPKNVGLKRLTLHKSATGLNVHYILLVECSHFLDNINQAANLLPVLRARICGYIGIFRIVESF